MEINYKKQRQSMVEQQIKARGISNQKVIDALLKVPRHIFVPDDIVGRSYYDGPLPIGFGQTISQPYIVAYMTELLELNGQEKILEIGTGSGYQTAILAEIAREVFTIEVIDGLLNRSEFLLTRNLKYTNIQYKLGNGSKGWQEQAPFDRIIITAAPDQVPETLFDQLADPGKLIAPVGNYIQKIIRYSRTAGRIFEEHLISVSFVPFV